MRTVLIRYKPTNGYKIGTLNTYKDVTSMYTNNGVLTINHDGSKKSTQIFAKYIKSIKEIIDITGTYLYGGGENENL